MLGAKHNSPYWLIWVGEMYRYGVGTDRDERKAFSYYEKAVALGDVDGIVKVGRAHLNGIGVPQITRNPCIFLNWQQVRTTRKLW